MKNIIKITIRTIALCLTITFCFSSCDDILDQKNPNQTSSDNFWKNLNETKKGIISTYAVLRNHYLINTGPEAFRSDMGWPGYGRPLPTQAMYSYNTWYAHGYTDSEVSISKKWDACYLGIYRAGLVIEALERLKGKVDENEWKTQMGEARFLRGLFYSYAYWAFNHGEIILHRTVPKEYADFHKPLSPTSEVFAFYMDDLKAAYELLPAKYTASNENLGRVSAGAAATILGVNYLYKASENYPNYKQSELDSAMFYFKDVVGDIGSISRFGYKIETDLTKMFTNKGDFNSESILEISYTTDYIQMSIWSNECFANRMHAMSTNLQGFLTPAWLAWKYKTEPKDSLDSRNWYKSPKTGVDTLRNVSLRASAMITLMDDEQTPAYSATSTTEAMSSGAFQAGGPACEWGFSKYKKYTNHDLPTERLLEEGSGKNIVLNRLSDVYLLYAECLAQKGNTEDALYYINKIRARWGLVLLGQPNSYFNNRTFDKKNYNKLAIMDHLMYTERPLELSTEGNQIRWQDLRRWKIIKSNFERLANDTYYTTYYSYWNSAGKYITSEKTRLVHDKPTEVPFVNNYLTIDYEYDAAALNYIESEHAFFPIPLTEKKNNNYLIGK